MSTTSDVTGRVAMHHEEIRAKIDRLASTPNELHERDFLLSWELSEEAIQNVLVGAEILRDLHTSGISARLFDTGLGIAIFRDKSTRTRYSFRAACNLVGLATEELDESSSQIVHGETVRETATMISFLTEVIGIRDDMFLGEGHRYMAEVARAMEEAHEEGLLGQRPSVINLQCDLDHPTQTLADLAHMASVFGGLEALRGKRIAVTWAHSPSYGKPLSVPQGIVALMTRFGMEVVLAHPPGYELLEPPLDAARRFAQGSGASFQVVDSMEEAFRDADIVYPKSWAPRAVMQERATLRAQRQAQPERFEELEREALEQNARHRDWECTEEKMQLTREGKALYMHCLPADISGVSCEAGEVSASVFERFRCDTYREAAHKPFVIAAIVLATRFRETASVLFECVDREKARRPL